MIEDIPAVRDPDYYHGYYIRRADYTPDMTGQSLYRYMASWFGMCIDEYWASDKTLPQEEETPAECFDRLCNSGRAIKNGEFRFADSGELKLTWTLGNPFN